MAQDASDATTGPGSQLNPAVDERKTAAQADQLTQISAKTKVIRNFAATREVLRSRSVAQAGAAEAHAAEGVSTFIWTANRLHVRSPAVERCGRGWRSIGQPRLPLRRCSRRRDHWARPW